jgi:predicted N-acyltransferase
MYLTPSAAAELAPVVGTPLLLTDLTATVRLDGCDSFDDYLGRLTAHRRRRIGHEMREFAASGFDIRVARLADVVEVVAPLIASHHGRYGLSDSREMLAAHLSQHAEHLGDLGQVLLLSEHGGRTVGALLIYEWADAWYARAVGLADGVRGQASAYFNLVYDAPIRRAVEHGMRRYVVGPSKLGAKVKRGADLEPRWSLLVGTGDLDAVVRRLSLGWNDRQLRGWQAELRGIGHELPAAAGLSPSG